MGPSQTATQEAQKYNCSSPTLMFILKVRSEAPQNPFFVTCLTSVVVLPTAASCLEMWDVWNTRQTPTAVWEQVLLVHAHLSLRFSCCLSTYV